MGQWWVIFGHFYLNHLSPLWSYFFHNYHDYDSGSQQNYRLIFSMCPGDENSKSEPGHARSK